jgi:uncharacterized protein YlxW (UPF0749 family)
MSQLVKVEGYSNLRKDLSSGGVINMDQSTYLSNKTARRNIIMQRKENEHLQESVSTLGTEINNIKEELTDIKVMLTKLLNKGQ